MIVGIDAVGSVSKRFVVRKKTLQWKKRRSKKMSRVSKVLLQKAGAELGPLGKTLSDLLVCPLSKQPLRY